MMPTSEKINNGVWRMGVLGKSLVIDPAEGSGGDKLRDLEGISRLLAAVGTAQACGIYEPAAPRGIFAEQAGPGPDAGEARTMDAKARLLTDMLDRARRQAALSNRIADRAVRAAAGRGAEAQDSLTGALAEVTHGIMVLAAMVEQAAELARRLEHDAMETANAL